MTEKHEMRDGRLTLFIDPSIAKPVWQARMRIPDRKGYIFKSTGTTLLAEACRVAEDIFDELRFKAKSGVPLKDRKFKDIHPEWIKTGAAQLSSHRQTLHTGSANRYFIPFFGAKSLTSINETTFESYWEWRLAYWSNVKEEDRPGNAAVIPAQKSILMEKGLLSQIFKWCKRKGYIQNLPMIEMPKIKSKGKEAKRRPHFMPEDMKKLLKYVDVWVTGGQHDLHRFQRKMVKFMCLWMYWTGMRPNEVLQVRWRDTEFFNGTIKIRVAPTTKTGERTVISMDELAFLCPVISELTGHEEEDDLVFCDRDGNPLNIAYKTIKELFNGAGVLKDSFGREHTSYSFRHTYATERLLAGVPVDKLAKNMGTSVQYIMSHYDHSTTEEFAEILTR